MFELIKEYKPKFLFNAGIREIYRKIYLEKILGSYSQNKEDLLIEKLLNKKKGFYMEIGAYHPTRLSNTYRFYKNGWGGILVEPNPDVIDKFKKTRPRDMTINMGVGRRNGLMEYYRFLIPALNTFSKENADESVGEGHKLSQTVKIKIVGINKLLEKVKKIDFLSLDTEGFDELILGNWPWARLKPTVICVETDVEKLLKKQGYTVVTKTKDNLIFVLEY